MTDSVFNLTVDENKIAVVTIDVPGEKMNTLRDSFADDLKALLEAAKQESVKGMVFISGKSDNFIAIDGIGYGSPVEYLSMQLKNSENRKMLVRRLVFLFNKLSAFPVIIDWIVFSS